MKGRQTQAWLPIIPISIVSPLTSPLLAQPEEPRADASRFPRPMSVPTVIYLGLDGRGHLAMRWEERTETPP